MHERVWKHEITSNNSRAYILNYHAKSGREGRITIGSPPEWTLAAARERAKELKRQIDNGADPALDEREKREADNMHALCDMVFGKPDDPNDKGAHGGKLRPRTLADYRYMIKNHVRPELGPIKVNDVEAWHIDKLHGKITRQSGPYRANRCISVLSKMFALAIRWKIRAASAGNPCKGVEKNQEYQRERYLAVDERIRLLDALDKYEPACG